MKTTLVAVRRPAGIALLGSAMIVAGCGHSDGTGQPGPSVSGSAAVSSAAATSAPASSGPAAADAVLTQYAAFWTVISPASQAPPDARRAVLAPYAADPELGRLLRGLVAAEVAGEGQYGVEMPHARVTSIGGDAAAVSDCQDASHAGRTSLATGRPITRGVARNPVRATLRRGAYGRWRVATVEFPGGTC